MAKNKILKNIFSLSLGEFATRGISVLINAYIARIFIVEGYGIISNVNAILMYAMIFVNLGFSTVGMRSISKHPEEIEKYVNNIFSIKLILAFISYFALAMYALFSDQSLLMKTALLLGGLQVFVAVISFDWFYQGVDRMEILGIRQVLVGVTSLLGVLIFIRTPYDIPLYMFILSASGFINNIWLVVLYIKKYNKIRLQITPGFGKELIKTSLSVAVTSILVTIISSFSIIYIAAVQNNYETGLLGAALKLLAFSILPALIVQSAFNPTISKSISVDDKRNASQKCIKLIAICGAIVATILSFYPEIFITIIFGEKFIPSANITRILMINCILSYYNIALSAFLLLWNLEKKTMYVYITATSINIILNLILIPLYSGIGAAVASVGSEITLTIMLSYYFFHEVQKVYLSEFIKPIILALISAAVGIVIVKAFNVQNIYFQFVGIALTFSMFTILILKFKIISLDEIRRLLKR